MPKARSMRSVWKGAIAFGLVRNAAVDGAGLSGDRGRFRLARQAIARSGGLQALQQAHRQKRSARTTSSKGVKQDNGDYVVLSDAEVTRGLSKTTQTIEIEAFVPAHEISFVYLERPYYLEPGPRADKVYTLLREAMAKASLIGVARIVMHRKEHLAALIAAGPALMLGTLRWANEIRPADQLALPPAGSGKLKSEELKMAEQLIGKMASAWKPERFADSFSDAIHKLVVHKVKAGKTATVKAMEPAPETGGSNVIDLTELLKNSLHRKGTRAPARKATAPPRRDTATAKRRRA